MMRMRPSPPWRHRPRELDADVASLEAAFARPDSRASSPLTSWNFSGAPGHQVDDGFVGGDAADADRVEEELRARRHRGDVVDDLERRGLGREQLVARVLVLAAILRRRCRRRGGGVARTATPVIRRAISAIGVCHVARIVTPVQWSFDRFDPHCGLRVNVAAAPNIGPSAGWSRSQRRNRVARRRDQRILFLVERDGEPGDRLAGRARDRRTSRTTAASAPDVRRPAASGAARAPESRTTRGPGRAPA